MKASTVPCSGQRPIHAPYNAFISTDAECASPRVASSDSQRGAVEELVGGRGDGPELADGPRFRRFCGGCSHAGVLRCLALRGSQTRPVEAILEICAMAQSSCHMSFACLQMPDELSAMIQGIVRERVRRNWPLVRAFEIRSGRRSLQQGEFVAVIRVMHCRRRIPSQSHPSSKPAALCSPVQCNMQRCAARTISAHSSCPDACVRL